jgi:hypothetical protein
MANPGVWSGRGTTPPPRGGWRRVDHVGQCAAAWTAADRVCHGPGPADNWSTAQQTVSGSPSRRQTCPSRDWNCDRRGFDGRCGRPVRYDTRWWYGEAARPDCGWGADGTCDRGCPVTPALRMGNGRHARSGSLCGGRRLAARVRGPVRYRHPRAAISSGRSVAARSSSDCDPTTTSL